MLLGFDLITWYGAVVAVALFYVLWASVLDTGHRHYQAIKRLVRPEPPEPPVVVLGHPGYAYSTETINERRLEKLAYLTRLDPYYLIENKDAAKTVTDVTTGVRRKDDSREHTFDRFKAHALAPGETTPVRNVSIPQDLFDGMTDQDHEGGFLFWVRFTAPGGTRWEVVYDPVANERVITLLA